MKSRKIQDDFDDVFFLEGGHEDIQSKYGEDVNNFKVEYAGINRDNRGCTDILCLLIFFTFIAAMGKLTQFGYHYGDVNRLTSPIDAELNFCGFGAMEGYHKMILTDFKLSSGAGILKSGVCIKECPKAAGIELKDGANCKSNAQVKCEGLKTYQTRDAFDFCLPISKSALPTDSQKGFDYLMEQLKNSPLGSAFQDMYNSSTSMYVSMGMALVWSIVYIYLMSIFAEQLAWCCVVLIQCGLLFGALFSFGMFCNKMQELEQIKRQRDYYNMDPVSQKEFDKEYNGGVILFFVILVLMATACCVFFCGVICARDSLRRAIDVIDAAADYIAHNKRVILVPNIHYLMTLVVTVVWIGAFVCVASLNEIHADKLIPQSRDIIWEKKYFYAALFMFFGYLWITAWIEYSSRFIVIMGACTYYFNNDRNHQEEEAPADISYGWQTAYLNHLGSIAFGSFIIALVRFIKFIFYYLAKKAQKASGDNGFVKAVVACATCILNCIERICDYMNEAAFCYMAVTGDHFLSSAWSGFLLNLKHGLKFAFANMIAKVFIFLGKVGIVVANVFFTEFMMVYRDDVNEVNSKWVPIGVVAIVTYFAASLFLSLFEEAIMALLTCLCFDMDANGGEPIYGPATFHDNYVQKASYKPSYRAEEPPEGEEPNEMV